MTDPDPRPRHPELFAGMVATGDAEVMPGGRPEHNSDDKTMDPDEGDER